MRGTRLLRKLLDNDIVRAFASTIRVMPCDALDRLTRLPPTPAYLVINRDHSALPGSHWTVLYVPTAGNRFEWFDSAGTYTDTGNHVTSFAKRHSLELVMTRSDGKCMGGPRDCAHFSLYFCLRRSLGWNLHEIHDAPPADVRRFVHLHFRRSHSSSSSS